MLDIDQIIDGIKNCQNRAIAKAISLVEDGSEQSDKLLDSLDKLMIDQTMVLGITGNPGAGKSTLTDRLIGCNREEDKRVGVIAIDPSSPISGGAIHGDRIRMMQHALDNQVVVRSMATRGRLGGLCASAGAVSRIMANGGCNPVIVETVGVGQSEMDIIRMADVTVLVTAPGLGDDIQALKAGLLEVADIMVVNKGDRPGSDKLMLELQEAAREKGKLVIKTVASEGIGVKELYDNIGLLFKDKQESGENERKRRLSRGAEVVDWCLEMLRPHLKDLVNGLESDYSGDPRIQGRKIVNILLNRE